ncbi:hypothetical protein [Anaerosalibacter massiliensis]|nr:hypothetical protein [Anaerosalibacter massiliensis]
MIYKTTKERLLKARKRLDRTNKGSDEEYSKALLKEMHITKENKNEL